jgi:hypothetical protein
MVNYLSKDLQATESQKKRNAKLDVEFERECPAQGYRHAGQGKVSNRVTCYQILLVKSSCLCKRQRWGFNTYHLENIQYTRI